MYPKIAKLRWMPLFGNNMNKFTDNICITEIIYNLVTTQGITIMVTRIYYGINCHVFFLV